MLHIAFNYHDTQVLLRLAALAACLVAVTFLGVIEFRPHLGRLARSAIITLTAALAAVTVYALIRLGGA